ncbi:CaiB/BaiF CoA transferase family protein [Natronorarus salvus]|uniref:CaiB/BaiF CoA transferase family protein n=1 Tax=Natronorarus salvus TaxID=3117733 RepID=UPI002F262C09
MVGEAREPGSETGPLSGITVLDASRVLVGPFCTMQLGDLGADVIKVERPGEGDQTRGWHPPTYGESDESTYYLSVNRNKRSVTIDLGTEEGQEVFRRLAREADVLVENFRVGTLERWGLGYESLSEENPGLIYAKLSGYGEWGPKRDEPAYDLAIQAEGGFMSITGIENGEPVRVGVAIADIGAGMYATQAILAALFQREIGTGEGQKIDVSLLDGQVAWLTYMGTSYLATGEVPGRMGSKHPNIVPYRAFEAEDGYVVVAAASEPIWRRLCVAIGREELAEDDRFATNADRVANREALEAILESVFGSYTVEGLIEHLADHDVPATPVNDLERVFDSPQVEARGMRQTVSHPTAGSIDLPGVPMHFSGASTEVRRHPPLLGEHTEEVLREMGYEDADIARFRDSGAI